MAVEAAVAVEPGRARRGEGAAVRAAATALLTRPQGEAGRGKA